MREIPLSRPGLFAIVDDCDYEILASFRWHVRCGARTSYAFRDVFDEDRRHTTRAMHRDLLGLSDPRIYVDHVNGNGLDNRRCNLRLATSSQNQMNRHQPPSAAASSRYRGVWLNRFRGDYVYQRPWVADIKVAGKKICLGRFADERDAALAYDRAAIELFGEFARLNADYFPELREEPA